VASLRDTAFRTLLQATFVINPAPKVCPPAQMQPGRITSATLQRFNLKNAPCAQILEPIASKIVVFCDICFGVNKFTFSEVIDTKPKTAFRSVESKNLLASWS